MEFSLARGGDGSRCFTLGKVDNGMGDDEPIGETSPESTAGIGETASAEKYRPARRMGETPPSVRERGETEREPSRETSGERVAPGDEALADEAARVAGVMDARRETNDATNECSSFVTGCGGDISSF